MGPLNFGWLAGGGLAIAITAFFFGTGFTSRDAHNAAQGAVMEMARNAWEERSLSIDEKINLWNEVIHGRVREGELIGLVERMDKVTGEAREALRGELRRMEDSRKAEQARAAAAVDELRRIKSAWGDQPVPDAFVCRMRGDANCPPDPGGAPAPAGGDRVAVRDGGR